MEECTPTVGVIGLGIMGAAMAENLVKARFPVVVYNRTREKADRLATMGATVADSPKALAAGCGVILLIVTDPGAAWNVFRSSDGLLAVPGESRCIVQMSTLDVQTTLELCREAESRGYRFLDCPVTGSKKQVEDAELILEAGGPGQLLEELRPVLRAVSKHIVHAGPVGSGTALKLCLNLIVAQMTTALAESAALAKGLGIDPALIFDVLEHSPALSCVYYKIKKTPLLSRNYPPAFSLANMLKDVRFMNQEAHKHGLRLPVTEAVSSLFGEAAASQDAGADLSVILEHLLHSSR